MGTDSSYLCQNLEIIHNHKELSSYANEISQLFNYSLSLVESEDALSGDVRKNIYLLLSELEALEIDIAQKNFPLLKKLDATDGPIVESKKINPAFSDRLKPIFNNVTIYQPSLHHFISRDKKIAQKHQQIWQEVCFDVDLILSQSTVFDRTNALSQLVDIIENGPSREMWSPIKARQNINKIFDVSHFICSKLQAILRHKICSEHGYSDNLPILIRLQQQLKDLEQKIIKQKAAEEKRASTLHTAQVRNYGVRGSHK